MIWVLVGGAIAAVVAVIVVIDMFDVATEAELDAIVRPEDERLI